MGKVIIQSSSNSRLKEIRKLRERKYHKTTPFFYMEGSRIVGEALAHEGVIETILIAPELIRNRFAADLAPRAEELGVEVIELSAAAFESISIKDNPQGVAAIGRKRTGTIGEIPRTGGIYLALNSVADPGNLGTIIRTADAVDARGIFLIGDSASPYDINAIRGSMGAIFSQLIVPCDYEAFLGWKHETGFPLIGTSDQAETDYLDVLIPESVIIMMGSEREGLTERQLSDCDEVARIPMMCSSDSLNLAVATGVMLYQAHNVQRGYRLMKAGL